jgi:hypothetical protein
VGADLGIGLRGVLYFNKDYRMSVRPKIHMGFADTGYFAKSLSLEVDKIFFHESGVNAFFGGGLGPGTIKFDQSNGTLEGRQLFLRGQVGALYKSVNQAYELNLFMLLGYTSSEVYTYDDADGNEQTAENVGMFGASEDELDELKSSSYYPVIGIEFSGYYGNFAPNKGKKGKKKKKNR